MKFQNMFWFDRALRTAVGSLMLIMAFFHNETILYAMGFVLASTGVTGFCPLHLIGDLRETRLASNLLNVKQRI